MATGDKYKHIDLTGNDAALHKVILHQQRQIDDLVVRHDQNKNTVEAAIRSSEALLRSLGRELPKKTVSKAMNSKSTFKIRPWNEILQDAECDIHHEVVLTEILSEDEMIAGETRIQTIRDRYDLDHKLDVLDWGISGIAGAVAALIDIFLVKIPSSKGLGGSGSTGGILSDGVRRFLRNLYSEDKIKELEKQFQVPYDASTSRNLSQAVLGLGPRSHRFQSLGHDPILGFIFGIRDILYGQFTAIDATGKLIVQNISGAPTGISFFKALAMQIGHLKSDISTAAGLPAPFMPLFQFLQFGDIDGRTIGELSRCMYAKGYDFGHFLAMSIPVMIIEILVRLFYFAKRMYEGYSFMDSLPINIPGQPRKPKLQTMLFTAHTIATASNAGKVYFMQNPLAINLPQWLWYIKSSYHQIKWLTWDKEIERQNLVQKELDEDWQHVNDNLMKEWILI